MNVIQRSSLLSPWKAIGVSRYNSAPMLATNENLLHRPKRASSCIPTRPRLGPSVGSSDQQIATHKSSPGRSSWAFRPSSVELIV